MNIDIWQKWQTASINPNRLAEATKAAHRLLTGIDNYSLVSQATNVAPQVIGCFHYREASFSFSTHLANGDPLWNSDGTPMPTVHDPRGLGPFDSWVSAAIGAIQNEGFEHGYHWDLVNALDNCEIWNGLGYREMGVPSPYVWAGTNHYVRGKYVADGVYDPNAVDDQLGCAAILKVLKSLNIGLQEISSE